MRNEMLVARMARGIQVPGLLFCFLTLLASWADASTRSGKSRGIKPVQVKAGTLKGVIKGYTGKPFAKTSLELKDAKGNIVARTMTNTRGEYVLKSVPPGKYTAVIGGKVKLPLTMTTEATVSRLMIVPKLSKNKNRVAGAGLTTAAGMSTWTWVLIGGGVAAAAVATPVVIHNSKSSSSSSSGQPISP